RHRGGSVFITPLAKLPVAQVAPKLSVVFGQLLSAHPFAAGKVSVRVAEPALRSPFFGSRSPFDCFRTRDQAPRVCLNGAKEVSADNPRLLRACNRAIPFPIDFPAEALPFRIVVKESFEILDLGPNDGMPVHR